MGIVTNNIETLKEEDTYAVILFALYKIKDIPEYSTISELSYILDSNSLLKLCKYYGGMTIRIPTVTEIKLVTKALVAYEYVSNKQYGEDEALKIANNSEFDLRQLKTVYFKLCEVLSKYSFVGR